MGGIVQNNPYLEVIKYGITLRRLTKEDLELLRGWRNDPKIANQMNYREYITPRMQKKWFSSVNNPNNFYFIVIAEGKKIGLADLKEINYSNKTWEAGLFIYDDEFLGTLIPFQIFLAQYDFGFFDLGLKTCYGRVLKSNTNAIKFNAFFGYELEPGQEGLEHQKYVLPKERYILRKEQLLKKLSKFVDP